MLGAQCTAQSCGSQAGGLQMIAHLICRQRARQNSEWEELNGEDERCRDCIAMNGKVGRTYFAACGSVGKSWGSQARPDIATLLLPSYNSHSSENNMTEGSLRW